MRAGKLRASFTRRASAEYLEGLLHIAADDLNAGLGVQDRIEAALDLLGERPSIGRPGLVPNTREFPVTRTPYTLVYRIRVKSIQVLRVLHQRREYP